MARRHWDADWLPTFVFNTLNRVTVVFAPLFSAASLIVAHHTLALLFLGSAARAILGFVMASRSDLCHHHLTLIYS